jgi:hypothetical protein
MDGGRGGSIAIPTYQLNRFRLHCGLVEQKKKTQDRRWRHVTPRRGAPVKSFGVTINYENSQAALTKHVDGQLYGAFFLEMN